MDISKLRALIAIWRRRRIDADDAGSRDALDRCAQELEALLNEETLRTQLG